MFVDEGLECLCCNVSSSGELERAKRKGEFMRIFLGNRENVKV